MPQGEKKAVSSQLSLSVTISHFAMFYNLRRKNYD
nr:MAG TPA: hypothetical protein [Caudoviricetes sp.]